jgi:hypothetical protein
MDRIGPSPVRPSTEHSLGIENRVNPFRPSTEHPRGIESSVRECSNERNEVQNIIILSNEAWENCSKYGEGASQCINARNNLQQNMNSNVTRHRNRIF